MSPLEALVQGYATLTGQTAYGGELPANASIPCAVLRPYAGLASPSVPSWLSRVQVTVYATDQAGAHEAAQAAWNLLHQTNEWEIGWEADGETDWYMAMWIHADPVVSLPVLPWQGADLYRAAISCQLRYRPVSPAGRLDFSLYGTALCLD